MKYGAYFSTLIFALSLSAAAFGAEKSKSCDMAKMTPEQRQEMATAHEKMAACLRSDKPVETCHKEMKQSCHDGMGESCSMMGKMHGKKGHGMMHDEEKHEDESESK